jgi:ribosomal-protein-alanine N-acetyltransferase
MEMRKSTDTIGYRNYDPGDLDVIVKLDAACFDPPFRFSNPAMHRFIEAANAWVTVAESDGELAGFCIIHREHAPAADIGYVVTIDVADPYRKHGIATQMLAAGEQWVRSFDGAGMLLHVYLKNDAAIAFYERMGYKRLGVQTSFYGNRLDGAMYWKDLTHR